MLLLAIGSLEGLLAVRMRYYSHDYVSDEVHHWINHVKLFADVASTQLQLGDVCCFYQIIVA